MCISRPVASALASGTVMLCVGAYGVAPARAWAEPPRAAPQDNQTFFIGAFDVAGVKLIEQAEVEAAVYPFLGPERSRADIDRAVEALQKAYQAHGYQTVVVDFPAQVVSTRIENIVRLRVAETPIGRLKVTGSRFYSPEVIRREAPALQEGQAPNITLAGQQITELNRLPGRRVEPLVHAGRTPGTVDVDLKVTDSAPVHASIELTNDHNQNTDPLRVSGTLRYDNLWQMGHSASFTYSVAPTNRNQSEIFAGSYLAPVWHTPFSVLVFGYHSNSDVASLGGTNVLGKGYAVGVRAIDQLPHLGNLTQSLSLGFDFKNFDEAIAPTSATSTDAIHYWPVTATYTLQRDGTRATTKASLGVTAGIAGLGSNTAAFENKRANARPDFVRLNLDITQTETLPHGFLASARLSGQLADQPLVSSEQFAAGGMSSVRGYLQSEAVGDEGLSGAMEVVSPPLSPRLGGLFGTVRAFVFVDGAVLRVLDPLPSQTDMFSLASAGAGLRVELLRHLKGEVALAAPLIAGAATHVDRPRATFSLKSDF